jgi:hypothetical protein
MQIRILWGGATPDTPIEILQSFVCSLLIGDYVLGVIVNPEDGDSIFLQNIVEHSFCIGRFVKSKNFFPGSIQNQVILDL